MKKTALFTLTLFLMLQLNLFAGDQKNTSPYYMSKTVTGTMDEVQNKTLIALKEVGFGLISEMNMHEKLNEKLGSNLKPYRLLGVCNPKYALDAIEVEENIGLMLPCKILLKETDDGKIQLIFANPAVMMELANNPDLSPIAKEVTQKLTTAFKNIK